MFLPGFHRYPLNSAWWGEGFTEWDLVQRARPLSPGQRQPRVPAGGRFDLSDPAVIAAQVCLAGDHGIAGFAIYHYWYAGKRPLAAPLDTILKHPDIDLNYSLCWANHPWNRGWNNIPGAFEVLINQTYETAPEDQDRHFRFLERAFADPRYIRIADKLLFQIYAPQALCNWSVYLGRMRDHVRHALGAELHISAILTGWRRDLGFLRHFDSVTLHQPNLALFAPKNLFRRPGLFESGTMPALVRASPPWLSRLLLMAKNQLPQRPTTHAYDTLWERLLSQYVQALASAPLPVFPEAVVDFDNTPRYGRRAHIVTGFSPAAFEVNLGKLATLAAGRSPDDIIFINAWNEWGEGMYLQPDQDYGLAMLEALASTVSDIGRRSTLGGFSLSL